jgi:hypothetical protein
MGRTDTSSTLAPLENASAQDWLGTNQDPDVLLAVPNLGVDHIGLEVDNLRAHVELHAKVLDLLELHVGADVSIDKVELNIENVRVQAMLKVKLENVVKIVDRVMDTIDNNPEILTNLTAGLGKGLEAGLGKEHATELEKSRGRLKGVEKDKARTTSQLKVEGLCSLTLVQFDDKYDVVYAAKALAQVPPLILNPRGSTALLDAIGKTVVTEGELLARKREEDRPGTVIVLVMTDGLENSSSEWTREKVAELLNTQKDTYGWKFIFMGSNQDAVTEGKSMGFDEDYAVTFATASAGSTYAVTSQNVTQIRSGGSGAYTKEQREKVGKE